MQLEAIIQSTAQVLVPGTHARLVSCQGSVPLPPSLSPSSCLQHSQICFLVNKTWVVSVPTLPCCQCQSWWWSPHPAPLAGPAQAPSRWQHPDSGPFGQRPCRCQMPGRAWRVHCRAASPWAACWGLSWRPCAAPSWHPSPAEAPRNAAALQPLLLCRTKLGVSMGFFGNYLSAHCQQHISSEPVAQLMEEGMAWYTQPWGLSFAPRALPSLLQISSVLELCALLSAVLTCSSPLHLMLLSLAAAPRLARGQEHFLMSAQWSGINIHLVQFWQRYPKLLPNPEDF